MRIIKTIQEAISKFYTSLPDRIRVYVYSGSSLLIATLLGLLSRDLLNLEVSNEYLVGFITFFTGFINMVQKEFADKGEVSLAKKNHPKTIAKLNTQLKKTEKLLG